MRTITIKKSVVAAYKGVGVTVDVMAERFKITTKEMNKVLVDFGMKAERSKKIVEPTYIVVTEDDMAADLASTTVNSTEVEEPTMANA